MKTVLQLAGLLAAIPATMACGGYEGGDKIVPTGTVTSSKYIEVKAGQVYDGLWKKYDRGSGACNEQAEGGDADAVFLLRRGATLKNAIIGKNQAEGVHCDGPCTLEFVWFEDVCEDAVTIKNDVAGDQTWIIGGGAYHASDKVIQHNGCGQVNVINYYVEDYGKLYRSCGNCSKQCARTVTLEGITAKDGGTLAGINTNYGDKATLKNICAETKETCTAYKGCAGSCEPTKLGAC